MRFYLGTDSPAWLTQLDDVPLFISHRRLARRRTPFEAATSPWALDSGGFTELKMYGGWTTGPEEYVDAVRRYASELGRLEWASPQDWMCEPWVISGGPGFVGTHLSVLEHQHRTVDNYCELRDLAPEVPFVPVLQGWAVDDYLRCIDLYAAAGVDVLTAPRVGIGSVCRRQATSEIALVFDTLEDAGLRDSMHGFGVKMAGVTAYADRLASADSLAWSFWARQDSHKRRARNEPPPPCGKRTCSHCPHYAIAWRDRLLERLARRDPTRQLALF